MTEPLSSMDLKRLIAEVSVQHGIRLDPDDPAMAVVTLNRLVLEAVLAEALQLMGSAAREFEDAAARAQSRAGVLLAQEVRESATGVRQEIQRDIDAASLTAREMIAGMGRSRPEVIDYRWVAIGLLSAMALFAAGACVGLAVR